MPVIAFANSKGGVGKSTSALVLAQVLAHHHSGVTLIDADPNQPLQRWATGDSDRVPGNLTVVPSVTEDTILDAIDAAASRDPFVLIDLEGSRNVAVSYAIGRSDLVVIPMQGSQLDADQAAAVIQLVQREERAFNRTIPYVVLFTRASIIKARDATHVRRELAEHKIPTLDVELTERSAYRTIFQIGGSIYDLTTAEVSNPTAAIDNAEAFAEAVTKMLG